MAWRFVFSWLRRSKSCVCCFGLSSNCALVSGSWLRNERSKMSRGFTCPFALGPLPRRKGSSVKDAYKVFHRNYAVPGSCVSNCTATAWNETDLWMFACVQRRYECLRIDRSMGPWQLRDTTERTTMLLWDHHSCALGTHRFAIHSCCFDLCPGYQCEMTEYNSQMVFPFSSPGITEIQTLR